MTWQPDPKVTIEGVDFTGDTIQTVRVVRGRPNVYERPRPSYAALDLIDLTGDGIAVEVGTLVRITLDDSAGTPVRIFTGTVSDVSARLYDYGIGTTPAAVTSIIAVGPLARLGRRPVFAAGRTAETDGDRIAATLAAALGGTWAQFQSATAWNEVADDLDWNTIDYGFDPADIDAGLFDLAALTSSAIGYDANDLVIDAAQSGAGILYETGLGAIAYANADRRENNDLAGYLDVDAALIEAQSLRTSSSLADVTNRVKVEYATGVETVQDDVSIGLFGLYETTIATSLTDLYDAADRATLYLRRHGFPSATFDDFTIRLDTVADDTTRDQLLGLEINDAVQIVGLPDTLLYTQFPGFVEGIEYEFDQFRVRQRLSVSDADLSLGYERWAQVNATLDWQTVNATLEWSDATQVTT